jgi:penicillin-binding protein 1A
MSPPRRPSGRRIPSDPDLLIVRHARRQRARRRKRAARRRRIALIAVFVAILVALFLATLGIGGAVAYKSGCSLNSLHPIPLGSNTFVYAADGSRLGSIPAERNRQPVRWSQISPWLTKATVAIEDKRYWEHGGVDPIGTVRALWADLKAGKVVQGGSTITQQLVRNLYISNERTFTRKLREACLAEKLSHKWTKRHILTAYLNQVYYGSQAYGVEAAAQTYYSRPARSLTLPQAALIAGLPQAPSQYDPVLDPQAAINRRDEVLRAMLDTHVITPPQYRWAVAHRQVNLKLSKLYKRISQPYFFSYVRDQLVKVYGERGVESGGLRVYTTIDPRLQRAAAKSIRDTLYLSDDPASAVVAINPSNGAIRAMTAIDPARKHNQFNLVAQAHRQAGSTFKTFVLAAAIEQGMDPETTYYLSAPLHCDTGPCAVKPWDVKTYDNTYVGSTSVERATLRSDNTVYARLTLDVGADKVAEMARKLGVRTPLGIKTQYGRVYVPAMGLGAIAVTPLDMASAYATLAAGGIYSAPMAIKKVILANGKEDTKNWGKPKRKRVVSQALAYEVTKILNENVLYGTGVGANFGKPAAGKTGTTDNHADAWFVGYTPQLAATVWVGYSRAEIPMENVHGIAVAGGTFPATIWHGFMQTALENSPTLDFAEPAQQPVYRYWHGEWQWSGGYYTPTYTTPTYTAPSYTTTQETTTQVASPTTNATPTSTTR